MAETQATTRPARKRTASKATTAKATPAKAAPAKAEESVEAPEVERYQITMEKLPDTKNYAVFQPATGQGCVGKLYAPLGTTEVKVLIIGPKG